MISSKRTVVNNTYLKSSFKMIVFNIIGALTSNSNTYFVAVLSLTILFLRFLYVNRSHAERERQFALLPTLTKNPWASLKLSLKLASLRPRGKHIYMYKHIISFYIIVAMSIILEIINLIYLKTKDKLKLKKAA